MLELLPIAFTLWWMWCAYWTYGRVYWYGRHEVHDNAKGAHNVAMGVAMFGPLGWLVAFFSAPRGRWDFSHDPYLCGPMIRSRRRQLIKDWGPLPPYIHVKLQGDNGQ